ncbi:MAG: EAL domain-containing protein [Xanthomonadales bacterium]|nr:EAL domain-containing protein [Xanthomonadales bacterium]
MRGDDLDVLKDEVERLAREMLPCRDARLDWIKADGSAAELFPFSEGAISVELADGRVRLQINVEADRNQPGEWNKRELGWIDLLDLRLRELLAIRELSAESTAARNSEHLQQALYAIADLAYSDIDVAELLARVHRIVAKLTYAKSFFVALYDDERDVMRFPYYVDNDDSEETDTQLELAASDYPGSLTFAVLHRGRSLLGPSVELRRQLNLKPHPSLGPECVDWLGVPMLEGDRVRGAVVVQSYQDSRRYSEDDRTLLSFVAQQTLSAVTRRQAQAKLEAEVLRRTAELGDANGALREEVAERQRAQRLQTALFRIAELASERGSLEDFYAGIHEVVAELLNARNFFISTISENREELRFPYFVDERDLPLNTRRMTNGITEWVLRNKQSLLATETEIRALIEAGEMVIFGTLPKCWLGVPLVFDDHAVGVMVVQSYDAENAYGLPDQDLLQFASFNIATAMERKQTQERLRLAHSELEQRVEERTEALVRLNHDLVQQITVREQVESRLKHEAFHDSLTGLPNRTALLSRLTKVLAGFRQDPTRLFAILFIDLDRFKVVNDSVGHLLGDELLIEAARRISSCVPNPDAVARLGGDEFTILLEDIGETEDAARVARRVLEALVDPIRLDDKEIYTSASIGIALGHLRYQLPEELLRDADVAMYRAKANGRQRFELFDEKLRQQALDMLDLESDIRRALARKEFEPYLQPIVRLADGAVLGYEALLRWNHASRGLLLPASFLGIAEDSGNVEQIDWQIYEQVFNAIPALTESTAYVGINVSARHFRSPTLTANLLELLDACKVAPSRVRIEITEGALLQNPDQACTTMLRLLEAGVLTSLDDFGTGYSSLSYLHRFPLHSLKIDRSFIADLRSDLAGNSTAVVRAILALASSLGMEVIAEGIETSVQCDALRRLDCSIGQGFHFARPRPALELTVNT